jgi:hypothetical protein
MSTALRSLAIVIGSLSSAYAQPPETRDTWVIQDDGTMTTDQGTYTARIAPDGGVTLKDAPNVQPDWRVLGAHFDITDAIMRSRGEDPYASAKLSWLDRSRDVRVVQGTAYRHAQLAQADSLMRANVDAMWRQLPDNASRKQALFEMWDECAETGDPSLVEAGKAARATLLAIATERLGPNAFSPAELSAFNARRTSTQRFDPNGAPSGERMVASR